MKILLVCRHEGVSRQVRGALLGESGIELAQVRTPHRAVQVLLDQADGYDLVLADGDLHPEGGFSLSRDIKAHARMGRPMPPVLLLIAREQDRWLASWSEADATVLKPVDPFDLAATARAVAGGHAPPELPGVHRGARWANPLDSQPGSRPIETGRPADGREGARDDG